ncbi:MAG TPA: hypothetical protein VEH84_10910, partial [Alphaproteobacteria bacterium]|nr:hypothetical protein [Alphaproteobacteria bacterium]
MAARAGPGRGGIAALRPLWHGAAGIAPSTERPWGQGIGMKKIGIVLGSFHEAEAAEMLKAARAEA